MTATDTTKLLAQLRTLLDLTNTEIQIAETRVAQARTDAVRRELSQNAANGRERVRTTVRRFPKPRVGGSSPSGGTIL